MTTYRNEFPFPRTSFVGWEKLFDELTRAQSLGAHNNYPPHSIIRLDDDHFLIEIATAGFNRDELSIEVKDSSLTVTGKKDKVDERDYVHKGIGLRDFTRQFTLAEHVNVTSANLDNGILSITLEREIPEEERPVRVEIKASKPR